MINPSDSQTLVDQNIITYSRGELMCQLLVEHPNFGNLLLFHGVLHILVTSSSRLMYCILF